MSTTIGDAGAGFRANEGARPSFADLPEQASRLGAALQELAHSLDQRLLETEKLGRITTQIYQGLLLDEILDGVFDSFQGVIPYNRIGFSLIGDGQMAAELLADPEASLDSDERQVFLSDINRQAGYMVDLIDDLLDVTKIESGRLDLHKEATDICEFLGDTVRRHANLATRKGIAVTLTSHYEGIVQADRKRLRQVLDNLISNAVKFSPPGTAVEVNHRRERGSWRVQVIDQGPVDSRPGTGSTFWFSIPDQARPSVG